MAHARAGADTKGTVMVDYERAWARAHQDASERIDGCIAALYDDDEYDPSCAPFCGCMTCIIREALDAAYPALFVHFSQKQRNKTIIMLLTAFLLGVLLAANITALILYGY